MDIESSLEDAPHMALANAIRGSIKERTIRGRSIPIGVFGAVASIVAAYVWIAALTPPVFPNLTVDAINSWSDVLINAVLLIGTLLGVRVLWILLTGLSFLANALVLSEAVAHPSSQAIGGFVLLTLALVLLLLPSVQRYERRRIRLVLE
jgi:hypothetical protein